MKSIFFKLVSLVIIAMALFNLSNGLTLMGLNPLSSSKAGLQAGANIENGVQVIRMDQKTNGYSPNHFVIYKNLPVKWIINSLDPHSCASSILVNQLGIRKFLQAGENVIEFTPQTTGEIRFSCTMGMYSGSFTVIEKGQ